MIQIHIHKTIIFIFISKEKLNFRSAQISLGAKHAAISNIPKQSKLFMKRKYKREKINERSRKNISKIQH